MFEGWRRLGVMFLLVAALLVGAAPAATADPVHITSGFVTLYGDGVATMSVQGSGFSAGIVDSGGHSPTTLQLASGSIADFNIAANIATINGAATIDGTPIRDATNPTGLIRLSADLLFDVDPFLVSDTDPTSHFVTFTSRFTMTGTISGATRAFEPLFSIPVFGTGSAGFLLRRLESENGVVFSSIPATNMGFTFDEGQTPVPEPTSMLLLGSGLAGIALRRSRLRRVRA